MIHRLWQFASMAAVMFVFVVMLAGCQHTAAHHLTQAAAVRIAKSVLPPTDYDPHEYVYRGKAIFYEPFRAWGVIFELPPDKPRIVGGGFYGVWIDDATGKFTHYAYSR